MMFMNDNSLITVVTNLILNIKLNRYTHKRNVEPTIKMHTHTWIYKELVMIWKYMNQNNVVGYV